MGDSTIHNLFLEALSELRYAKKAGEQDPEQAHVNADTALLDLIESVGKELDIEFTDELIETFCEVNKWYA